MGKVSLIFVVLFFWWFVASYNPRLFIVTSESMYPAIKAGSLIVTISHQVYRSGDVVTYRSDSQKRVTNQDGVITHRIVRTQRNTVQNIYLTKGDANKFPDDTLINKTNIYGKVLLKVPYLGYLILNLKQVILYFFS